MGSIGLTLSFKQVHKQSRYFSFWRPLPFLPSTFPVTARFSRPCRLKTCPRKSSCRCRIVFINSYCTPAAVITSTVLFFSVHDIRSILLKNQISTAINQSFIAFEITATVGIFVFLTVCRPAAVLCTAVNDACHPVSWHRPNKGRGTHRCRA